MKNINTLGEFSFLKGGGEMGERTRNFDWQNTPVGNYDTWPQTLRYTISIILNSKFPMFLWWGPELVQFYNDAYRPSFGNKGKHPAALGQRGPDCWPEIWPTIGPLIDQVLSGGDATWSEDQLIPIYLNGKLEDVYWTFGYSPVNDETGKPMGVLVICTETTQAVKDRQRIGESEQNLRNTILQAPVAMCIFREPNHVVDIANDLMFKFWGITSEAVVGKPIFDALPEVRGQGFEELVDHVYNTGETHKAYEIPVTLLKEGTLETAYVNLVYEAFRGSDGEISGVIAVVIEVTDQVMYRKKIEEAEERARMAIESADLGFYEIDMVSRKMITDSRLNQIFGYVQQQVSRTDFISAIYPDDLEIRKQAFKEALITGQLKFEVRIIWKDKSVHWIKTTGKLIYDLHNKPIKIHGVVQDITTGKETELHKDDFISIVSHELKTPLTSLKGYSYILIQKFALLQNLETTDMLSKMNDQINRLIYIVQDLLDVTRIEANKIRFREDNFDLGELLQKIAEEVQSTTQTHQIIITQIYNGIVFADKERTSQVIANLLGNAIRYSPGAERVIISATAQEDQMICSIKDFGKGVPKNKQTKIFERFYQVSDINRFNAGLGLGLYISAQIIIRQNGKIWLESEPGKGATFYFSLPLKAENSDSAIET